MKNSISMLFTLFFTTLFVNMALGQTSSEEYNYVSRGYQVQIESGLDMKKGYEFEDIDKHASKERESEL